MISAPRSALSPFFTALLLGASVLAPVPLAAQSADPLLTMSPGARVAGLGRVAVALAAEPEAVLVNPAAAAADSAWVQAARVSGGSLADVSGNVLSAGLPLAGGGVAVALGYDDYGDLVATGDEPGFALGEVSLHDAAVAITYARRLGPALVLGATGRYVRSDRGLGAAAGAAADLGALVQLPGSLPVTLGAAVANLGGDLEYALEPLPGEVAPAAEEEATFRIALPTRLRVGGALGAIQIARVEPAIQATLAYDVEAPLGGGEGLSHHAGVELSVGSVLAVRAGALSQANPFEDDARREWGTSVGVGIASNGWVLAVAREMGLSSLGDPTHLSAGYRF